MTGMSATLRTARTAALVTIAALITAATVVAFAESFRGLLEWAARHGLPGWWAVIWPLMVDVFVATGELALFVSVTDRWDHRSRYGAWVITLAGLAASVAGNVGHLPHADWLTRLTGSVPPVAAASALAVGLGVLKRVVQNASPGALQDTPGTAPEASAESAPATPVSAPEPALEAHPERVPQPSRSATRRPSPSAVKRMSGADLAPYAGTLLERDPGLPVAALMRDLRVGREKASEALRLARRERLQAVGE